MTGDGAQSKGIGTDRATIKPKGNKMVRRNVGDQLLLQVRVHTGCTLDKEKRSLIPVVSNFTYEATTEIPTWWIQRLAGPMFCWGQVVSGNKTHPKNRSRDWIDHVKRS